MPDVGLEPTSDTAVRMVKRVNEISARPSAMGRWIQFCQMIMFNTLGLFFLHAFRFIIEAVNLISKVSLFSVPLN